MCCIQHNNSDDDDDDVPTMTMTVVYRTNTEMLGMALRAPFIPY